MVMSDHDVKGTIEMSAPQEIDIYETILREEQKNRLFFWALSTGILICSGLVLVALT